MEEPLSVGVEPMTGSIRVAFASNRDGMLDGHFGSCRQFLVYQVSGSEITALPPRSVEGEEEADDRNQFRTALIGDCQLLFVISIGGPAAAKVVKAGIHPLKRLEEGAVEVELEQLRQTIATAPPPWLAKAMGYGATERARFTLQESEA